MKPAPFVYHRATSTADALRRLAAVGPDGAVLAGGQSLIPLMNFRVARPEHLVDVNFVDELEYIRIDDGRLAIGARVRQAALERSEDVARHAPLLLEAVRWVAHPPIRHRGTVVGSIAHADPAAELPAALVALDGDVVLRSEAGERVLNAEDFFDQPLMTALQPGELITEIRVPVAEPGTKHAVVEVSRRHADFAVAGAAVSGSAIALFGVGPAPVRAREAERMLERGASAAEVAAAAVAGLQPRDDVHGSAEYRRRMAKVCVERAL